MSKILIDATSLIRKITGIEYYTIQIIKNLLKYDNENEYIILFRKKIHNELIPLVSKGKFIVCKFDNQIFCEQIWIPLVIFKEKPDLVHFPAFPQGLFVNHKNIIFTLHDTTMWNFKQTLSWKNKLYMKPLSELAIRKSKKIFTVSEDSKRNIISIFKNMEDKVVVTSESISEKFHKIDDSDKIEELKEKYKTGNKYLLSVCSLEPRKNIPMLLQAFSQIIKEEKFKDIKLVLVGRKAWGNNIINEKILHLKLENNVIITDYVTDEELLYFYNGAYCFIYPSLHEGFGLPILEAMACGVPVVTSNNSSIPEVAGDAAILLDPHNKEDIANGIKQLLNNTKLREELIKKGDRRIEMFSWENIVNNMQKHYKETIS